MSSTDQPLRTALVIAGGVLLVPSLVMAPSMPVMGGWGQMGGVGMWGEAGGTWFLMWPVALAAYARGGPSGTEFEPRRERLQRGN